MITFCVLNYDCVSFFPPYPQGCLTLVEDNLDAIAISVGILGIIIGIIEVWTFYMHEKYYFTSLS